MSTVFRKVALERLSSPEQLDQLMQITQPRSWLALAAWAALLLVALGWGIFGSIPTESVGTGILIRRGGVSDLVAAGTGQVEEVLVAVGAVIEKGQPVATIRQEGLGRKVEEAETRRAALATEYQDLLRYAEEQKALSVRNRAQQRANLEQTIKTLEKDVEILSERIKAQRELLTDGLITQQTLLATEQELNAARDKLAGSRLDLGGLDLERLETEQQLEQQIEQRRGALRDVELELRELRAALAENVEVVSPYAGRVLELMADRGDVVSPGTPILSLEILSEELMAVLYVPASAGKQVRPGMTARISPSNVKREEFGYMLGEVLSVAEFPSTSRGMRRLLANDELVTKLLEQGPPIQVDVTLMRDGATPTGYRWSSSRGPELEISSGTLAEGSIVVRQDRPISLLIPTLRSRLGI